MFNKIKISTASMCNKNRYMLVSCYERKKITFYKRYLWIIWVKWFESIVEEDINYNQAIKFLTFLNNK